MTGGIIQEEAPQADQPSWQPPQVTLSISIKAALPNSHAIKKRESPNGFLSF
jgi:hypothetical protein